MLIKIVLKQNKLLLFLLCVLFSCHGIGKRHAARYNKLAYYPDFKKNLLIKDTSVISIVDTFMFEESINAYIVGDVYTKKNNLIRKKESLNRNSYMCGVFICDSLMLVSTVGKKIIYDAAEVSALQKIIYNNQFGTRPITKMNAEISYTEYYLSIDVVFIDSIIQKIPKFGGHNNKRENEFERFELAKIPTYLITNVHWIR